MRSTEAQLLFTPKDEMDRFLPEGPRELLVGGVPRVAWVNIQDGPNSRRGWIALSSDQGFGAVAAPGRLGFLLPVAGENRIVLGLEKSLVVFTFGVGSFSEPLATIPDSNPRTIMNDAEIVPGGKAIVFGTKDTKVKEPIAQPLSLYRR